MDSRESLPNESGVPAAARLPLSALLSQTLVAFTIEFDNEFEHRTPHRTTIHGATHGAKKSLWLASMVMWSTCMKFVDENGISVAELEKLARTPSNLNGMARWGYIVIDPKPSAGPPRPDSVIRATEKGREAQRVWRPLMGTIEKRWEARFGKREIGKLRKSLGALAGQLDAGLPDCLPILRYGLFSKSGAPALAGGHAIPPLPLSALLSRVLLAFAIEFERESDVSLAICANVVRVLTSEGVRLRDLPLLSGVSKEAIAMAFGILRKKKLVALEPDSRVKLARLTAKGREAQDAYHRLVRVIEERWRARFSEDAIDAVHSSLERLVGEPLFLGLQPYPDGWRAAVRKPATLPHYPMVLHRGGYPDGS